MNEKEKSEQNPFEPLQVDPHVQKLLDHYGVKPHEVVLFADRAIVSELESTRFVLTHSPYDESDSETEVKYTEEWEDLYETTISPLVHAKETMLADMTEEDIESISQGDSYDFDVTMVVGELEWWGVDVKTTSMWQFMTAYRASKEILDFEHNPVKVALEFGFGRFLCKDAKALDTWEHIVTYGMAVQTYAQSDAYRGEDQEELLFQSEDPKYLHTELLSIIQNEISHDTDAPEFFRILGTRTIENLSLLVGSYDELMKWFNLENHSRIYLPGDEPIHPAIESLFRDYDVSLEEVFFYLGHSLAREFPRWVLQNPVGKGVMAYVAEKIRQMKTTFEPRLPYGTYQSVLGYREDEMQQFSRWEEFVLGIVFPKVGYVSFDISHPDSITGKRHMARLAYVPFLIHENALMKAYVFYTGRLAMQVVERERGMIRLVPPPGEDQERFDQAFEEKVLAKIPEIEPYALKTIHSQAAQEIFDIESDPEAARERVRALMQKLKY